MKKRNIKKVGWALVGVLLLLLMVGAYYSVWRATADIYSRTGTAPDLLAQSAPLARGAL